jgi:hypothetical protein
MSSGSKGAGDMSGESATKSARAQVQSLREQLQQKRAALRDTDGKSTSLLYRLLFFFQKCLSIHRGCNFSICAMCSAPKTAAMAMNFLLLTCYFRDLPIMDVCALSTGQ